MATKPINELSVEELKKKINSAKFAVEKNSGRIKQAAEKKLSRLESELESRGAKVEKEVKEVAKDVEKEAEKVEKEIVDKPKPKTKPKAAPKKAPKKRPRTYASPTEKFELVIDGKTFKFDDLKSKQECERAKKAVEARYKETKEHWLMSPCSYFQVNVRIQMNLHKYFKMFKPS